VPSGRPIYLSGAGSTEPDDRFEDLDFKWAVTPLFAKSDGTRPEIVFKPYDKKQLEWIAKEPGPYEISLDVTDDHRCNPFRG
jgi:hypothetical protein